MISTELIRDTGSFRSIAFEWNELLADSACRQLFLSWEWMYCWWRHLAGHRKLHIVTVRRDGQLIAIAPLAQRPPQIGRLMPFRVLEFLGSGSVGADYLSVITRLGCEDEAQAEITARLASTGQMLELVRVDKGASAMHGMTRQICQAGWGANSIKTTCAPYAKLTGMSWEGYLASLDRGHQKYLNRKLKKLHRDFSVELKTVGTDEERELALDWLIDQHLQRWSRRGGSTAFHNKALINFHRDFSRISLDRGWLRLYTLELDGELAAAIYIFKFNNVFYYYQMAFDERYGKYSVGMVIMSMAIRRAIDEGAREFDFLHDGEAYKFLWARDHRDLLRLEYYPPHRLGRLQQQIRLAKSGTREVMTRVGVFRKEWG